MLKAYKVADETFVIPEGLPVKGLGALPINAMVIRGEQPMILDTLATVHRETFLAEAFALVEPKDVRWLFLSHEDRDHSGSIMEVLNMCPQAKLVTNYLGYDKLGEEFDIDYRRVHILNDGDSLDIGDRVVTAIRPPLYDSSATTGLWDPKTEVYYGADCFGAVLENTPDFVDELADSVFEDGYFFMNRANHVWFEHVKPEAIIAATERIRKLGVKTLVSGHGPTERKNVDRMFDWINRIGDMPSIELPGNDAFHQMMSEG